MSLKTQAEIIMERGRVKASTTVYSGPGYPIDPKMDEARILELFLDAMAKHLVPQNPQFLGVDIPLKPKQGRWTFVDDVADGVQAFAT